MLDLAFILIGIFIIVKACKGEYKETACNIAFVVGIIAGVVGSIVAADRHDDFMLIPNIIVMIYAFLIRFAARHLANKYIEKRKAEKEDALEREMYLHSRYNDPNRKNVYADDNFDDEELRFGKGGWTDNEL